MKKPAVLLQLILAVSLLTAAPGTKSTSAVKPAQKKGVKTDPPPLTKVQPEDVIAHLEQSIGWYRQVGSAEQLSGVPTDLVDLDLSGVNERARKGAGRRIGNRTGHGFIELVVQLEPGLGWRGKERYCSQNDWEHKATRLHDVHLIK